ncbi:MAG TPA: Gmad2 immunoglobulin-like domain-containing protein [Acidimicrobiia bacterium]
MRTGNRVALVAALALAVASCGSDGSTTTIDRTTSTVPETTISLTAPATTTTISSTSTSAATAGRTVYFLLDEVGGSSGVGPFLVPVYREGPESDDAASDAVELLLAGPTAGEMAGTPAMHTAIPEGTSLLGLSVDDGVATVDLSAEFDDGGGSAGMFARLAQVVFTVTRATGVDEVTFELASEPVAVFSSEGIELSRPQIRSDYYDWLPAIFVDMPAWGEPVTSPIEVQGLSNVFEAVSQIMLTDDDGLPLFENAVMASCGTGCWGDWEASIPYEVDRHQVGALIVWEYSAKDGSRVNIREYPLLLR